MQPAAPNLQTLTSNDLKRTWGDYLNPRAFSGNKRIQWLDEIAHPYLNPLTQKVGSSVFKHDAGKNMAFVGMLPVFYADRFAAWSARKVMALGEILNLAIPFARLAGILAGGIVRFAVFVVALILQSPFILIAGLVQLLVAGWRNLRQANTIEQQDFAIRQLRKQMEQLQAQLAGGLQTVPLTPSGNQALDALVEQVSSDRLSQVR